MVMVWYGMVYGNVVKIPPPQVGGRGEAAQRGYLRPMGGRGEATFWTCAS